MSRAAVFEILSTDAVLSLAPYSIDDSRVFPSHALSGSRNAPADGYFLVIRWEEIQAGLGIIETATIWIHRSRESSRDFLPLREALFRIKDVMTSTFHYEGSDGVVMARAEFKGIGPDLVDEGYGTITKYAVFDVNQKVE